MDLELIIKTGEQLVSLGQVAAPVVEGIVKLLNAPASTDAPTWDDIKARLTAAQSDASTIEKVAEQQLGKLGN